MAVWAAVEDKSYLKDVNKHAGGKARQDIDSIFLSCGYSKLIINAPQEERIKASKIKKLIYHFKVARCWKHAISQLNYSDVLIIQFPLENHTLLFQNVIRYAKKKKISVIAFIHDLELLRGVSKEATTSIISRWRIKCEELDELRMFDKIVVHNEKMKEFIHEKWRISENKMYVLGIFDYLFEGRTISTKDTKNNRCIIAGNLVKKKSGYVYHLPPEPEFEIYGINYEGNSQKNIHYHGSYPADELPFKLEGDYGVVWDGDSPETCLGFYGEYLRYNNPHKVSLYLACGIPVIIWKEAALAQFVKDNQVGILVGSLSEISGAINKLSPKQYQQQKQNAIKLSLGICKGENTKIVLRKMGLL